MTEFHLKPVPGKLNEFCVELDAALEAGKISEELWFSLRRDATEAAIFQPRIHGCSQGIAVTRPGGISLGC